MSLHALDDVDDAIDATRSLLTPVDFKRWLKLAFVAFFIGGPAGNIASYSFNGSQGEVDIPILPDFPAMAGDIPRVAGLVIAVVAIALFIGLAYVLIGSVMEFVFVESIRTQRVRVRETWGDRWGQGVRLFTFRAAMGLVFAAMIGGVAMSLLAPVLMGPVGPRLSIVVIVILIPFVLAIGFLGALVYTFTTMFVVPIMLVRDCGVLAGWARLWSSIRSSPWQYAAFALVGFILNIAAGIVVGIVIAIPAFVLLLPVAPMGFAGFALLQGAPVAGVVVLVFAALIYIIGLLAVAAVVQVPVIGFLRYYAMLVLGDIEPELDPLPDIRSAIRGGETD